MIPSRLSYRSLFLGGFVACAALIGFALFAQYHLDMDPCPLCILQRVAFIGVGLIFLVGGLHAPRGNGRWVYSVLAVLGTLSGAAISARHLWIQSLPPDAVPSCGAPLGYLIDTRGAHGGFLGVLKIVLSGSGECATVQKILGLSMPWWALIWFVILGAAAMFAATRRR